MWGFFALCFFSCSFDYGTEVYKDEDTADVVMENVEYVRVRNGIPQVEFDADKAQRYEEKQLMRLDNFSFQQFDSHTLEPNARGSAGSAEVELDSGNVRLRDGVSISVESEEISIGTKRLDWEDKARILSGGENEAVTIEKKDGSTVNGWGFTADTRQKTWEFRGGVAGSYVHEDDDDEDETESGQ